MMAGEATGRPYKHLGGTAAFHAVSHHANIPDRLVELTGIQTWHMQRFARFVDRLAATPDGDGTLLDHSLLMYGSNMSNSDRHNNYPLPIILLGGANGKLKGGRQIVPPEHTPVANLHLTVLNMAGIPQEKFSNSTGLLPGV
jgi:hypothetical protein